MQNNLSFSEFVDYRRENIRIGWWEDRELEIRRVRKNNGLELTALLFPREDIPATPTFYLEHFYETYLENGGGDPSSMISIVRNHYERAEDSMIPMDVDKLFDYEKMRDSIIYRLVNYEKNAEMLQNCPHIRVHDLALTFRSLVSFDETAVTSALVNNDQMEEWGVSRSDLLLDAQKNSRKLFPPVIYPMYQLLEGADQEEPEEEPCMYVATNRQMLFGAVALLYQDVLEEFGEKTGGNFYVMPSSVHEVILVPDRDGFDPQMLCSMVREVNETVVSEDEVLSDSVYYYDCDMHKLIHHHEFVKDNPQ